MQSPRPVSPSPSSSMTFCGTIWVPYSNFGGWIKQNSVSEHCEKVFYFFQRRFLSQIRGAVHALALPQVISLAGRGPRGLHGEVAVHHGALPRTRHPPRPHPRLSGCAVHRARLRVDRFEGPLGAARLWLRIRRLGMSHSHCGDKAMYGQHSSNFELTSSKMLLSKLRDQRV